VTAPQTVDVVLERARRRLIRLTPAETEQAVAAGAVVVDIRPAAQRAAEGSVPGAVLIERNVLEWRLDPTSDARLPFADPDLHVIVCCQEGYASSLAAESLQELGLQRATDVIGGQTAWRELTQARGASGAASPELATSGAAS